MTQTYMQQLREDVGRIERRGEEESDAIGKYAFKSGAYMATSRYYAQAADHITALHNMGIKDPKRYVVEFFSQPGGPSPADIAILLREMHVYLSGRPELNDAAERILEAAQDAEEEARKEEEHAEASLERERRVKEEQRNNLIERGVQTC